MLGKGCGKPFLRAGTNKKGRHQRLPFSSQGIRASGLQEYRPAFFTDLSSGFASSIRSAPAVMARSSFRDVLRVREDPPVDTGSPASIVIHSQHSSSPCSQSQHPETHSAPVCQYQVLWRAGYVRFQWAPPDFGVGGCHIPPPQLRALQNPCKFRGFC